MPCTSKPCKGSPYKCTVPTHIIGEGKTLLIDGDIIAFEACAVDQAIVDWDGNGAASVITDLQAVKDSITQRVGALRARFKAAEVVLCVGGPDKFRANVWPAYKTNRSTSGRPLLLESAKLFMREHLGARYIPGLEGDDLLGAAATDGREPTSFVVCSIDKDLLQLPGLHYNWRRDEAYHVLPEDGLRFFAYQTLTGDVTDNYPGLPGWGPVKASKLVDKAYSEWEKDYGLAALEHNLWVAVRDQFPDEKSALVQARCAYILHHADILAGGSPKLWTPGAFTASLCDQYREG